MSLASYIGTNVKIPVVDINGDEDYDESFYVGQCFSNESNLLNVKESQFSTKYVHEISSHWGIEIVDPFNSLVSVESKEKFKKLLDFMTPYLKTGDYFELYSCWVGEEWETRNGILNLRIEEISINSLEIPEKTLVIIKK